jgi:propanol-preferring alcohol dehydrogenase
MYGGQCKDGGLAEYMVAPRHALIPAKSLDLAQAAPLVDAALTAYRPMKPCLSLLAPGTAALVIGVGGLGHMAIELLRVLTGAKIIAVDPKPEALELAKEIGVDVCLQPDESTAEKVKEETDGLGAMAVLDFVGNDATLQTAAASVAMRGRIAIVGLGGRTFGTLPVSFATIPRGVTVGVTVSGTLTDLAELVALAESGMLKVHITRFSFDEIETAYERLREQKIEGRRRRHVAPLQRHACRSQDRHPWRRGRRCGLRDAAGRSAFCHCGTYKSYAGGESGSCDRRVTRTLYHYFLMQPPATH